MSENRTSFYIPGRFLSALDEIRRVESDYPSRSEQIRRLIQARFAEIGAEAPQGALRQPDSCGVAR